MPLSPELKKLLDDLKARADRGDAFAAIRDDAEYVDLRNAFYQPAYNDGVTVGEQNHKGAKTALENKLATAERERDEARTALDKLKKDNPDQAALHKQYGDKIEEKDREIERLKAERVTEKKSDKRTALRNQIEKGLLDLGVDPHKSAAAADASLSGIVVNDDLSSRILQPGQQTAYAGDEATQVKALVADIFKTVPKTLITARVPGGGTGGAGGEGGESRGGGGTGEPSDILDRAAEAAKKKFERPGFGGNGTVAPLDEVSRRLGQRVRA